MEVFRLMHIKYPFIGCLVILLRNIPPEMQEELLLSGKIFFVMSNGQTNPNRPVTMMKNLYSCIDENNDSVNRSWIVFHHGMVAKLTSAAEFSAAEDLSL